MKKTATSALALGLFLSMNAQADTTAERPSESYQAPQEESFPELNFKSFLRGSSAVDALKKSGKLAMFAKYYGMTERAVLELFKSDPNAVLDKKGRLFYTEPEGATLSDGDYKPADLNIPLSQTFELESNPSAPVTLYLDFNGATVTGTAWNSSYGVATIQAEPFSLDSTPNTFSDTELLAIQNIWRGVAEDYAPFDVNVTTKEPPASKLNRDSSVDNEFGVTTVITKDWTKTIGDPCGCGGFAYVGQMNSTSSQGKPAWVFYNNLGNNAKNIHEATSHEIGHVAGLLHDGKAGSAYYGGHGSGATGWAPIMGVGYGKPLVQWSKGEYTSATQTQDDYAVMQGKGVVFSVDEHGNTFADATQIPPIVEDGLFSFRSKGIIQGPNDADVFEIKAGAGELRVNAIPLQPHPNLDIMITLMDDQGDEVAQFNQVDVLEASGVYTITEGGKYFIKVEGTGKGEVLTTGYSKYGSVGYYTLDVQAPIIVTQNQDPVAKIAITKVITQAPAIMQLAGTGSTDEEDGSVSSYSWEISDGSTSTSSSFIKTFQNAGIYTVTLTVTDSEGATGSATEEIVVSALSALNTHSVREISATANELNEVVANVLITDESGNPIKGAKVFVEYSGAGEGQAEAMTDEEGRAYPKSTPFNENKGSVRVDVVNVVPPTGFVYDSSMNTQKTASANVD